MVESSPEGLNPDTFLRIDKENMGTKEYKDSENSQVRFHAANKEFYKLDSDGNWKMKIGTDGKPMTKRNKKHRFSKDPKYVDRMVPVYEKATKGSVSESWFADYIKMTKEQSAGDVTEDCCVEAFIATKLGYCWGVQTLRTQVSQHKTILIKRGVKAESLSKIPSLKVFMPKPRPTFTKSSGATAYTDEEVSSIQALLIGL